MLEPNRLFFALWPDDTVRGAAHEAAKALKLKMQPRGYLTAPERYHVTLLFLGDFVAKASEAAALQAAAQLEADPVLLSLDQAGSFRNAKIPWWLGMRAPPPGLAQLHQLLHEQLLACEVVPERMKFVPHLTVLRDAGMPLPRTEIAAVPWPVSDFVLVRSRLDLKPVRYELLGRWPLRGRKLGPPGKKPQLALF